MPGLGDLFGSGSIAEQMFVWGVLNQIITQVGSPFFASLAYLVNQAHPVMELSPADLAVMVVRNVRARDEAAAEAKRAGIDGDRFDQLVAIAGDAPGPDEIAVALRRGLIPEDGLGPDSISFRQGIAEGRLRNKWADTIKALAVQWPTPTDALDALLQGQIDQPTAHALYAKFGGNPDYFTMLFDTRGSAPTPNEAATMANRGIIPWEGTGPDSISFQQAFLEGPWRNKWLAPYRGLAEYLPPPRTVTAMLRSGGIPVALGTELLRKEGLSADLAAAYVADATHTKAATAKDLTESQIVALYQAKVIALAEAVTLLGKVGVTAHDADLILTAAGLRAEIAQVNSAISKVRSSVLARHISTAEAKTALTGLGVASAQADAMIRTWRIELDATPKTLTEAQIVAAWNIGIMAQATAQNELVALGYRPLDAWTLLSIKNGEALPNRPG